MRLFVALDLPEDVKDRLEGLCHGLPGARWVRDRQFHLTLSFLGDVDGPGVRRVAEGLAGVRGDPFELRLAGLGHFPPRGAPRVVWAGAEGGAPLLDLAEGVRRCLRRMGLGGEDRRFAPHVTLARLRDCPLPRLRRWLEEHPAFVCEPFPVSDFQLYASVLGRSGASHRLEASYPLLPRRP